MILNDAALNIYGFNPRTHTGCDSILLCVKFVFSSFNPRTHTGCDSICKGCSFCAESFNPRTHTGCDLKAPVTIGSSKMFQSTHPHGVRHKVFFCIYSSCCVSIHAPTRGATTLPTLPLAVLQFQSTHPHGVRLLYTYLCDEYAHVSIHAPTRGATRWRSHPGKKRLVSIHAPTRGAT